EQDAKAVVERAIKAHGGADALTKAQTLVRNGTGSMTQFGQTVPFTDEGTWSLPDRLRVAAELDKKFKLTIVLNGDKGWQSVGGPAVELSAERLGELREEAYVLWLTTLTPLTKSEYTLTPLAEIKVNGDPAVGVLAKTKGRPDVKLYFDKKSDLLVKVERRA